MSGFVPSPFRSIEKETAYKSHNWGSDGIGEFIHYI